MNLELSAHDVTIWRGERCLVTRLSFRLGQGQVMELTGANGTGKTSLIRVLAGIGRLDEGEVRWNGVPLQQATDYAANLAYVGHLNGLKSQLTTIENIVFYQSISENTSEITANEVLARFNLSEVADRLVGQLSMGQRHRAALARLLLSRAKLWLLDEPLSSLDAAGIALVTGLVKAHVGRGGLAVLATHQPMPLDDVPVQKLELGAP